MSDEKEPHPLPLTRRWIEDYRRQVWKPEETRDLSALYGLDARLVEWFEAADHGTCHCGRPGLYVEQKANTWVWYCPDHRPHFRTCHICGKPGVAFEHAGDRWLWYCERHTP